MKNMLLKILLLFSTIILIEGCSKAYVRESPEGNVIYSVLVQDVPSLSAKGSRHPMLNISGIKIGDNDINNDEILLYYGTHPNFINLKSALIDGFIYLDSDHLTLEIMVDGARIREYGRHTLCYNVGEWWADVNVELIHVQSGNMIRHDELFHSSSEDKDSQQANATGPAVAGP